MKICKKSKKKRKNIHRVEDLTPSDAPGPGLPPLLGRENGGFGGERNRRVRKIAGR